MRLEAGAASARTADGPQDGLRFPEVEGRASTTATCREVLADAAGAVDPGLEARIRATGNWRREYAAHLRELTLTAARAHRSLAVAERGLESMAERLRYRHRGRELSLEQALATEGSARGVSTGTITGTGPSRGALRVPYRGAELEGDALLAQLERWTLASVIEPSVASRVAEVVANPGWLALGGRTVVLVGAASEIGPLAPLCAWGVDVVAIDLPAEPAWQRIRAIAERGAGTVRVPLDENGSPGLDPVRSLPDTVRWLSHLDRTGQLVMGMHAYADGGAHVLVSAAFDTVAAHMLSTDAAGAVAFLGTPTDAYVVPEEVMAHARAAHASRRARRVLQAPPRAVTKGRAFSAPYADGEPVADALIPQQGPNYAIAKRLQQWRGIVAQADGQRVSFNVAPATLTRSVTKNALLAAAYNGAHHFGIEIFRPDTTRALMAALLVYDLQQPPAPGREPEELFSQGAAHGGLWRAAYDPRSVLPLAAVAGLPGSLRRRGALTAG